ncbi:MAG: hypothetical protein KQI81_01820 [Deltaproteobacteria bacterium]|nr:hypothetical protein [Deltaproteobacteria bacterium]
MSTTQLFVELLVIGFGVVVWCAILIAGLLELPFDKAIFDIKLSLWPPLLGVAYVFGILLDRLMYSAFGRRKNEIEERILGDIASPKAPVIERIVMEASEPLNYMIHYNRSRSRICRAWFLNFFLIGISFIIWHYRVNQMPAWCAFFIISALVSLSAVSYWVGGLLEEDHYNNIRWSYNYCIERKRHDGISSSETETL